MTSLSLFSRSIHEHLEDLANEVVESVVHRVELDIPKWEKEQAVDMYVEFFRFLAETLIHEEDVNGIPESIVAWSKKNSEMQVAAGGEISEIIRRYPPTREILTDIMTRLSIEHGLSVEENAFVMKQVHHMLDASLNETFCSFKRLSDQYKEEAQKELLKLSAPIVPVKDEVVVLSLVGYMGLSNAQYIIDHVVPRIAEMQVTYVIVDFSGVATLNDGEIIESFQQIGDIFWVMGLRVITTGLRPKVVQRLVHNGASLSSSQSFATVKQAIESIE